MKNIKNYFLILKLLVINYIDLEHFNSIYKKNCNQFLQLYDFKTDNKIKENDFMFQKENLLIN